MNKYEMATLSAASAVLHADESRTLEALGDQLAELHEYPVAGISALHYHLIQKHNWLPRDVRDMSIEDMKLACASELEKLKLTEELVDFRQALSIAHSNMLSSVLPSK